MKKHIYLTIISIFYILFHNLCFSQSDQTQKASEQKPPQRPFNQINLTATYIPIESFEYQSLDFYTRFKLFQVDDIAVSSMVKLEKIKIHDQTPSGYFPENLYNVSASFRVQNPLFYVDAAVISKSDKPYHSQDEFRTALFAFYNILPQDKQGSGLYAGVVYFPYEPILSWEYPFPFVNYQYHSKDLTLMAGIPFFVRYNFLPFVMFNFFYLPTLKMRASIDLFLSRTTKVSLEGSWWEDNYLIADRKNKKEKIFFETIKTGLRFSQRVFKVFELSIYAGRTLKASYFKGSSFSDSYDEKTLSNSWIFEAAIKTNF